MWCQPTPLGTARNLKDMRTYRYPTERPGPLPLYCTYTKGVHDDKIANATLIKSAIPKTACQAGKIGTVPLACTVFHPETTQLSGPSAGLVSDRKGKNDALGRIFLGSLLHCSESRTVKHVGTPSFSAILLTSILLSTLFGGIPFVYVTFQGLVHTGHFRPWSINICTAPVQSMLCMKSRYSDS